MTSYRGFACTFRNEGVYLLAATAIYSPVPFDRAGRFASPLPDIVTTRHYNMPAVCSSPFPLSLCKTPLCFSSLASVYSLHTVGNKTTGYGINACRHTHEVERREANGRFGRSCSHARFPVPSRIGHRTGSVDHFIA